MPGIQLQDLPATARRAWLSLRDALRGILGEDLVAMWAHGGTTAVENPPHAADLDTYVILARRPAEALAERIDASQEAIARELGVEWDAWYVLADDARRPDAPRHAFREGRTDTTWAINRAHWLAGRYVNLHGPDPDQMVPPPTWPELVAELSRELEHIERHVLEGDTDPYEATYALLNGSRILHSLETRDPVITKRAAGAWAIDHLPGRWQPALQAAVRTYDGEPAPSDAELIAADMAPFVAFVRERLPDPDRPADALPRWSGA
jgi:hypothetical protein